MRTYAWIMALTAAAIPFLPTVAQPPETIVIQGQLRDAEGQPRTGLRDFELRFFDAATGGTQLGGAFPLCGRVS